MPIKIHVFFLRSFIDLQYLLNLSPFLFAVFLNDLESYLEIAGVSSLDMVDSLFYERLDIYRYMKIFLVLYADDALLFSESLEWNAINVR